jgi:hypothetical protein
MSMVATMAAKLDAPQSNAASLCIQPQWTVQNVQLLLEGLNLIMDA